MCKKHYDRAWYAGRPIRGATVGNEVHVVVKLGIDWDLEKQADLLLIEVFGDQPDWFTEAQLEATRKYREVYFSSGAPGEFFIEGSVLRAYNPLIGNRPRRSDDVLV